MLKDILKQFDNLKTLTSSTENSRTQDIVKLIAGTFRTVLESCHKYFQMLKDLLIEYTNKPHQLPEIITQTTIKHTELFNLLLNKVIFTLICSVKNLRILLLRSNAMKRNKIKNTRV